jgi:hypothetical protein
MACAVLSGDWLSVLTFFRGGVRFWFVVSQALGVGQVWR